MYYTDGGDRYVHEIIDDIYCDKHRLAMTEYNGFIYFVAADEKGFALNSISLADQVSRQRLPYQDAITLYKILPWNRIKVVYAVDKRHAPGNFPWCGYTGSRCIPRLAIRRSLSSCSGQRGNVYVTILPPTSFYAFQETEL